MCCRSLWRLSILAAVLGVAVMSPRVAAAQELQTYLENYFAGAAIAYGSGAGVSSSRPRIEVTVQYCASGAFYSSGRSCRPNLYASGYQCTPFEDAGRWRIVTQGQAAELQWLTRAGQPGSLPIGVRQDGTVVDQQGNPFVRVAPAQC